MTDVTPPEPIEAVDPAAAKAQPQPPELSPALAETQAAGVDVEHLRRNLRLTPAERLARLQAGLRMLRTLRTARRL